DPPRRLHARPRAVPCARAQMMELRRDRRRLGSYEPSDRSVIAVEPSMTMIRQRPVGSAPAVQASATHLPFRSATFEASLAILTVHHWPDRARGLGELARVARDRIVILDRKSTRLNSSHVSIS